MFWFLSSLWVYDAVNAIAISTTRFRRNNQPFGEEHKDEDEDDDFNDDNDDDDDDDDDEVTWQRQQ